MKSVSKTRGIFFKYSVISAWFEWLNDGYHYSKRKNNNNNNFTAPFQGWGSTALKLHSQYEEKVYFLTQSPQGFLVLICLTSEKWKTESTLEPLSVSQPSSVFQP